MDNEKKFYSVTLSDGTKNIVTDGYSNDKAGFNELLEVDAMEVGGDLIEIITGKKILDAETNYNSNIFDVRKFVEENYSLFGIRKKEIEMKDLSRKLHFITRTDTTTMYEDVNEAEMRTKMFANREYASLLQAEQQFREEINKGRKK